MSNAAYRELEQLKFALDQSAIVATTDVTGRIKYANDKFCEISKYSREELLGQDHRIINSGYHSQAFMRELWQTIAQGRIWRGEIRNRAKDGSLYWVDSTIVPFLDEHGKPWQYMAIRYDITERKQQEERLRDQAALTALGQMAAVVAHEVRNPLAGIRGGAQIIGSLVAPDSEASELVHDIVTRIDSLNAVVEDLLLFARQRDLRRLPVDLHMLLSDVVSSTQQDPALAGIEIDLPRGDGVTIQGDLDLLRVVFSNVLLNAAQAMAGTGHIIIDYTRDESGCCVIISIADTGPGIASEARDRVFEPFFTTKSRGTGLGLPTARRFIEAHGGTIDLFDRPGGGTVVRIKLPEAK